MKEMFLALSILMLSCQTFASWSAECRYVGEIEKMELSVPDKVAVKIQSSRRTLKTWLFGRSVCKEPVGRTFSTTVPLDDDILINLDRTTSTEFLAFLICPELAGSCFWGWNSNKLEEL